MFGIFFINWEFGWSSNLQIESHALNLFSNYLFAVIDVFFKPWNGSSSQKRGNDKGGPFDPLAYLEASVVRNQLFESGEGLNVFSDEVSMNNAYARYILNYVLSL